MGVGRVILTADQVLHVGDVVSRSDGFGTAASRKPVRRTMSISFLDKSIKAGSGPGARNWGAGCLIYDVYDEAS